MRLVRLFVCFCLIVTNHPFLRDLSQLPASFFFPHRILVGKSQFEGRGRIGFRLVTDAETAKSATFFVSADDRTSCALNRCQRQHQQCETGESPTLRIKGDVESCVCKSMLPEKREEDGSGFYVDQTVVIVIVVVVLILLIKFLLFPLAVTACMPILGYQSGFCAKLQYFYCHPCESSAACCCILCCGEIPESLQSGGEP